MVAWIENRPPRNQGIELKCTNKGRKSCPSCKTILRSNALQCSKCHHSFAEIESIKRQQSSIVWPKDLQRSSNKVASTKRKGSRTSNRKTSNNSSSSSSSSSSGNSKQQQKKKVTAPPAKKKRKRSAGSTSRATPKKQSSFSAPIDALLQRAEQASKSKEYQEYVDNWNKQQAISNRAATSALQAVKPQQTSGIVAQSMLPPKLLAKNALKASTSNTSSPVASSSSSSPLSLSSSSSSSSSSSVALSSLVSIPMEVQTEFNPLVVVDGLGKKDSPALGETFLLWE